jgi:hypothetical protein
MVGRQSLLQKPFCYCYCNSDNSHLLRGLANRNPYNSLIRRRSRKDARHWWKVANVPIDHAWQRSDGGLVGSNAA